MIQQSDGHYLKWEKYASGHLKSKQNFIQLKNGSYVADGFYVRYYENGIVADSANYKNGVKDDVEIKYHPNGEIAEWLYRMEGIPFGLQSGRDTNGNWTSVVFSTRLDSLAFVAKLNRVNEIESYLGMPIYLVERNHNSKAGETFSIANLVVQFCQYQGDLSVLLLDSRKKVLYKKSVSRFEIVYNSYCYFFDYKFDTPGIYYYQVNYGLIDNKKNKKIGTWQVIDTILVK